MTFEEDIRRAYLDGLRRAWVGKDIEINKPDGFVAGGVARDFVIRNNRIYLQLDWGMEYEVDDTTSVKHATVYDHRGRMVSDK